VQKFHRQDSKSVLPLDKAGTTTVGVREEGLDAKRVQFSFINYVDRKYSSPWVIWDPVI
jgi:hypothetical protein